MTYELAEAALATRLRTLSAFDEDQVEIGDWRIVARGNDNIAVLEYVSFITERLSSDTTMIKWTCRINLLAEYKDDESSHNILRNRRDEIILDILQNPTLASAAFDAIPLRGESEEDDVEIGGVSFLKEFLNVEITEHVSA